MLALDALKTAVVLFLAAVVQVSVLSVFELGDAACDLTLVTVVAVALLRGPIFGVCAGFWGGLVLDTASLETLGLTSLLLVLAGYWTGRFGEATTRSSTIPLLIAVAGATVGVVVGGAFLHFLLGDTIGVGRLVAGVLVPSLVLNLLAAWPVYRLLRRAFPVAPPRRRPEVSAVV